MHRLNGELFLALSVDHGAEAGTYFPRAATSLAHLWQQQGQRRDASDLLAPVEEWVTEGFDTADLQDAKQ